MNISWAEEQCVLGRVVDGDTIDVIIDMGFYIFTEQRLRLNGVDTPERGKPGYDAASAFVAAKLKGMKFKLITHKGDKYGRFLADVFYYDLVANTWRDLAKDLVAEGLARSYSGGAKPV